MTPINTRSHRLARRLSAAAFVGTALVAGVLTTPATASAKMAYDHQKWWECLVMNIANDQQDTSRYEELGKACCEDYSGVWNPKTLECDPPPKAANGGRQFPGQVALPADLRDAPAVTTEPPRPRPITR
jgi:hypothetical protein